MKNERSFTVPFAKSTMKCRKIEWKERERNNSVKTKANVVSQKLEFSLDERRDLGDFSMITRVSVSGVLSDDDERERGSV